MYRVYVLVAFMYCFCFNSLVVVQGIMSNVQELIIYHELTLGCNVPYIGKL